MATPFAALMETIGAAGVTPWASFIVQGLIILRTLRALNTGLKRQVQHENKLVADIRAVELGADPEALLRAHRKMHALRTGQQTLNPPVTHPVFDHAGPREGRFLELSELPVVVTHAKPAEDGRGLILRVVNTGDGPAEVRLGIPGRTLAGAWQCGTLEDNQARLVRDRERGVAVCPLVPRQLTTVRLQPR